MPLPGSKLNVTRSIEGQDMAETSRPEVVRGSVVASWAEKLRAEGLPEELIDYMRKAEFEAWVQQQHHKVGSGLYYSDDFQDLPPRFKKKIIEIAYQISQGIASKEDFIPMITNQPLKSENDSSNCKTNNQPPLKSHQNSENEHIHAPHCVRKGASDGNRTSQTPTSKERPRTNSLNTSRMPNSSKEHQFTNSKEKVNDLSRGGQGEIRRSCSNDQRNVTVESCEKDTHRENPQRFAQSFVPDEGFRNTLKSKGSYKNKPNNAVNSNNSGFSESKNDRRAVSVNERTNNRFDNKSESTNMYRDSSIEHLPFKDHRNSSRGRKAGRGRGRFKNDIKENMANQSKPQPSPKLEMNGYSKVKNTSADSSHRSTSLNHPAEHSRSLEHRKENNKSRVNSSSSNSTIPSSSDSLHLSNGESGTHINDSSMNSKKFEAYNILEVTVSDSVEDTGYWKNYISYLIKSDDFKILAFTISKNSINVAFPSAKLAKDASYLLRNCRKDNNSAFIRSVSIMKSVKTDQLKKCAPLSSDRIPCQNMEAIEALYDRQIEHHLQKIQVVENELTQLQKGGSKNKLSIDAVKGKLTSLSEMQKVFTSYYKEITNKLKTLPIDRHLVEKVNELKNLFTHECNCLDGCLPIYAKKQEILKKVKDYQITVIVADTGSGKSTQLVQYLHREGYSKKGMIICTQPRKIAAVSVCEYISSQMGTVPGQLVGYETGTRSKISSFTKVSLMTDYTLLRKCNDAAEMSKISCIIVDEAHERSLYTDLLLGMLKRILVIHPDLKLIITSATIDPEIFLQFYGSPSDAVINVPGRMYPVEVLYQNDEAIIGWNYLKACVDCVCNIHSHHKEGGILVFLTSPAETEEAKCMLEWRLRNSLENLRILALHGKQDLQDQLSVFDKTKACRKIIFATNSAETSLTIPGIKFVVDSGMSKQLHYDRAKRRSALVVDFISRSSANQRKGRAGRTQPGYCYRMYTEKNYNDMAEDALPQILCAPLLDALVQILELNIQPEEFHFLCAPPKSLIRDAMQSLQHLGAVRGHHLTALGKKIAKFPVRPQLAKLIIESHAVHLTYEAIVLVSMLSVSGRVFCRTEDNKKEADQEKVKFCHSKGDLLTLLTVFHEWSLREDDRAKQRWCELNFINSKAMMNASNLITELTDVLHSRVRCEKSFERRLKPPSEFLNLYDKFESILFSCFSENLFIFSGNARAGYLSPFHDGSFFLHPSSALCYLQEQPPAFIICGNILKTSRSFLVDIVPVTEKTIMEAHQADTFEFPVHLIKGLKVVSKVYHPIGEVVLRRHILGKEGANIKAIEEKVKVLTETHTFNLEVNVQKGEIVIFAEEQFLRKVSAIVLKAIDAGRGVLEKEESIQSSPHAMDYNIAVGSGGLVHDVILPGESREVIVNQTHRNFNIDVVLKQLEAFGSIISHSEVEHGSPSVRVTFKKVDSAQKALKTLQTVKGYHITQGSISIPARIKHNPSLFEIEVTWRRLYCNGSGSILFEDDQARIEASFKFTAFPLYVDKTYIVLEPSSRNPKELCMRNLPPTAEIAGVKGALRNSLPSHLHSCDVNLNRKAPYETSHIDITVQNKRLHNIFAPFAATSKDIFIDLKQPEKKDSMWKAIVSFTKFEDGEKAISKLKNDVVIGQHKADLSLVLKFVTYCRINVFKVLEKSIRECESKFKKVNRSAKIITCCENKLYTITASCNDVRHLSELKKELNTILQGRHIKCLENSKLMKLFSQNSSSSFGEIEQASRTVIFSNTLRNIITIFGSKSSMDEAEQLITNCANDRSVIRKTKVFDLLGRGMPSGFTKMLYSRYCYNLQGLRKSYKLSNAYIDFAKHQLVLEGSLEKINHAEEHLERLCEELHAENQNRKESNIADAAEREVCPVCLDVITFTESIRLENCGHSICKPCIHLQIKSEVFPVVCVKEGCGLPFYTEDFRKIFNTQPTLTQSFKEATLKFFLTQNTDSVRHCPMPNCLMVYRPNGKEELRCQGCGNTICTQCHCLYHTGMTCDMYRETQLDEDYPLKAWQKQDSENRKSCPSCSMPIEKDGGCNHMMCSNCKQHICWKCLAMFKTDKDVYEHLPVCPADM